MTLISSQNGLGKAEALKNLAGMAKEGLTMVRRRVARKPRVRLSTGQGWG
jgi:hypothetical protein